MSAMKAVAAELDEYWQGGTECGGYRTWSRELPDRALAIIVDGYRSTQLIIGNVTTDYPTVAEAVLEAGRLARAVLVDQMAEWA